MNEKQRHYERMMKSLREKLQKKKQKLHELRTILRVPKESREVQTEKKGKDKKNKFFSVLEKRAMAKTVIKTL